MQCTEYNTVDLHVASEDKKLIRIVLVKSDRSPANCWLSLVEGQYESDPFVFDKMEKKMTLERFQREVCVVTIDPTHLHSLQPHTVPYLLVICIVLVSLVLFFFLPESRV